MFLLSGASTDNLPPGVLYKVKATYKYQAEDMDELSFEVGELIDVIEYDDPEEQVSAGWRGVRADTDFMFDVSGGGLADGSQGVHWPEGFVPGELHQTHLEIWLSPVDLKNSAAALLDVQIFDLKIFYRKKNTWHTFNLAGHVNFQIMLRFAEQNWIFALYIQLNNLDPMESKQYYYD